MVQPYMHVTTLLCTGCEQTVESLQVRHNLVERLCTGCEQTVESLQVRHNLVERLLVTVYRLWADC